MSPVSSFRTSRSGTKDSELLTLDAIYSGLRFQKTVAEGWIKVGEESNTYIYQIVGAARVMLAVLHLNLP